MVFTYENGNLIIASTRGNGTTGEEVTAQALTIKSVPLTIPAEEKAEVKGECIMRRSAFRAYNETAVEPLKNPRNAAAGAIRNLDPKITASRRLDMIFYDVNYIESDLIKTQSDGLNWLKNNKFKTEKICITSDIEEIITKIEAVDRGVLDFDIDGMVIKVDDFALRERLGYTDKFPRWAIAYKFPAEETTTTLNDVIWQVGRTGKLTPLALLKPVELCGATVKKATLNNYSDICRKKVRLGSTVFIRRSNDVIPEILSAVEGTGRADVPMPEVCPACGAKLYEEGAHIFCPNTDNCRPQIVSRLAHFVSKDCMDIDGLSEKTLGAFYDSFGLTKPHELYDLNKEDLLKLESFKDKKADNVVKAIKNSKEVSFSAFINALGIPNVGKKLASDLSEKYANISELIAATEEELLTLNDVGEIVAKGIVNYFANNASDVDLLLSKGLQVKTVEKKEGVFSGQSVVLTGSMEIPRSKASKMIEERGGKVLSSVTKQTTLVVVGENAGSKLVKAQSLGIKTITETEFLALINA